MIKIAILASHNGTGFDAINQACKDKILNCKICVVISNNTNAQVLQKSKNENIPNYLINNKQYPNDNLDEKILDILQQYQCDYIFLSGYMKKLGDNIICAYRHKIFNSHPSLLPKFGGTGMYGRFVHEAVIAANEKQSGVTIHEVTQDYDEGKIILQKTLPIFRDDTVQSLESKIKKLEKTAIVKAFIKLLAK